MCERHSLPQGSSIRLRGFEEKDCEPARGYKTREGLLSTVCLETVIPFPASGLLEIALDSEGSAGVLLEKQGTKTGFQIAETVP